MTDLTIAYTHEYLNWQLGRNHPTNPVRAKLAVRELLSEAVDLIQPELDWDRLEPELAKIHAPGYVARVRSGYDAQWGGCQPRLGEVAAIMFAGTVELVERLLERGEGVQGIYFNPQGAKHHAHYDHSSGFCVFNDMAWAARRLGEAGLNTVYIDWDAHHGDGVEALLRGVPGATTVSIHDGTIFPGTGLRDYPREGAYNYPLARGAGDRELLAAVADALEIAAASSPDVLLLACGADGLAGDPLSSLNYTIDYGIAPAALLIREFCEARGIPIVVGGAGGYQPLTETPAAWVETIRQLMRSSVMS